MHCSQRGALRAARYFAARGACGPCRALPASWLGPVFPVVAPRCFVYLVLPTRSAMMRFLCPVGMPLPLLGPCMAMVLPRLRTVMMKFPFRVSRIVLLWRRVMVMLRFPSCARIFFTPLSPLLFFACNLPCRLAATAMPSWVGSTSICCFLTIT
jgi:hypothetical protein